ncbi:MAG: ABC transporter permease subunit [Actinomycetota bacterium]
MAKTPSVLNPPSPGESKPSARSARRTAASRRTAAGFSGDNRGVLGLVIKIVLLGMFDAFAVWLVFAMSALQMWIPLAITAVIALLINWIYLGKSKRLPAKYLTPGVIFLLIFQIFVVFFSGYIAFTNYSDGHNSTKSDAISAIQGAAEKRVPDSPTYAVNILRKDGKFYFLVTDPNGVVSVGSETQPLTEAKNPILDGTGTGKGLAGYETLTLDQVLSNQEAITALSVPVSSDPANGSLRTDDASSAYLYKSNLTYDAKKDIFTDETGAVYSDDGAGEFATSSGQKLSPGWKIEVGFKNFTEAFTNKQLSGPLLRVTAWTFVFAIMSVLLTFALGLFLAMVLNHPNLRGKKFYRVLVILPYAFPVYLSGLVWAGLLNPQFGFVNQVLFGGIQIPWLTAPLLAQFSVILVNVWLGYPYMFLVSTGALQSLPEELNEAARVDGASPWRAFRSVKLPLLLVSIAPLLIASFAFNFNNFNVVYMLTRGWPRFSDTTFDIGSTDLLITMVYKVAFGQGGARDYGLASALSILIFLLVGTVSIIAFRRTKALEDIN